MKTPKQIQNECGAALVISLIFIAILAMLGTTAVVLTTTDMQIGRNYNANTQGFYDANAGINFAVSQMESGLSNESFSLPSNVGGTSTLSYTTPSGFSFSISDITKISDIAYSFTSANSGPDSSSAPITVIFERDSPIKFAAFGDSKLDTKNGGNTLSYNSASSDATANDPTHASFQTTHKADVGSNDWLVTHNGANIDGDGVFGEKDDGAPTTNGIHGGTNFYGAAPRNAGRIDPDPMGINSGGEYDPSSYSVSNDNGDNNLIEPDDALSGGSISLGNGDTLTLFGKSGGSDFYLTSITLNNNSTLTIDATNGPVNLFLTGAFDAKNGATITVIKDYTDDSLDEIPSYDATAFNVFSNSNNKIDLKHSSDFTGMIYAPFAPVDVKNSANMYGAVWADNVDIKNSGAIYFDAAIKDAYPSNDLTLISWQRISG